MMLVMRTWWREMLKNIGVKHGNVNPENQSVHQNQDHALVEKQNVDHAGDHEDWLTHLKVSMISMIRKPGRWVSGKGQIGWSFPLLSGSTAKPPWAWSTTWWLRWWWGWCRRWQWLWYETSSCSVTTMPARSSSVKSALKRSTWTSWWWEKLYWYWWFDE